MGIWGGRGRKGQEGGRGGASAADSETTLCKDPAQEPKPHTFQMFLSASAPSLQSHSKAFPVCHHAPPRPASPPTHRVEDMLWPDEGALQTLDPSRPMSSPRTLPLPSPGTPCPPLSPVAGQSLPPAPLSPGLCPQVLYALCPSLRMRLTLHPCLL